MQSKRFSIILSIGLLLCVSASATETYEYDALGRLIKVTQDDASTIDFNYDDVGNREAVTVAGSGVPDEDPNTGDAKVIILPLNGFTILVVD